VEWTDEHYPLPSENTDTWSIVLHAVCGKEAPRIACAVGTKGEAGAEQADQSSPVDEALVQAATVAPGDGDCAVKKA